MSKNGEKDFFFKISKLKKHLPTIFVYFLMATEFLCLNVNKINFFTRECGTPIGV